MQSLFLLSSVALGAILSDPYTGPWNFITRQGSKLYEDGQVYRFSSVNVPNILLIENRNRFETLYGIPVCQSPILAGQTTDANGYTYALEWGKTCIVPKPGDGIQVREDWSWKLPTPEEQEDMVLAVKGMNGRVIRTYTLGFGWNHHVRGIRSYNEEAFKAFDYLLFLARKHGIRLIIPLVNNHNGDDSQGSLGFGSYVDFCAYRGKKPSQFYTDPQLVDDFKNLVQDVLVRVNTFNGIAYKDDPTVLFWETGNELGGWTGTPPAASWTIAVAQKIKSIAPKALVMDGTFGGLNAASLGRFQYDALVHPQVDGFSNHYYYGGGDINRAISDTSVVAGQHNKVFILGEFGFQFSVCQDLYSLSLNNAQISGALIWALRGHSRDGGFYTHSEGYGYFSYHVPGFAPSTGFSNDDATMVLMIRGYGLQMQGLSTNTPFPVPGPAYPVTIQSTRLTRTSLRWFGATWAKYYWVYRRVAGDTTSSTPWKLLTTLVQDGVVSGSVLFQDQTNLGSAKFCWYLIQPVGQDGGLSSSSSLVLGPYAV